MARLLGALAVVLVLVSSPDVAQAQDPPALSDALQKALPQARERLSSGVVHEWTLVLLEAARKDGEGRVFPQLRAQDLEPLAARALEGAATPTEKKAVVAVLGDWRLASMAPQLRQLLNDRDPLIRATALYGLGRVADGKSILEILPLLTHEEPAIRSNAAYALGLLEARDAVPTLVLLLKDPSPPVRSRAGEALARLNAKEAAPDLERLLVDSSGPVRLQALDTLARLRVGASAQRIASLLQSSIQAERLLALESFAALGNPERVPAVETLLKDADETVQMTAASCLCRLGSRAGVGLLVEKGGDLYSLNALRQAELVRRLDRPLFDRELEGTRLEILQTLGRDAGLVPDGTALPADEWKKWSETWVRVGDRQGRYSALDMLRQLTGELGEFVVEPGRLRLLPPEAAQKFWKEWAR